MRNWWKKKLLKIFGVNPFGKDIMNLIMRLHFYTNVDRKGEFNLQKESQKIKLELKTKKKIHCWNFQHQGA
jgi:hypothetical protein